MLNVVIYILSSPTRGSKSLVQLYQVVLWQGSLSVSVPAHFVGGEDLVSSTEPLGRQVSGGVPVSYLTTT